MKALHFLSPVQRDMVRFTLLSGLCWLVDLALLLGLTQWGWSPATANMTSSLITAAMVYMLAARRIHAGKGGTASPRVIVYLVYTLAVIVAASWMMAIITVWFRDLTPASVPDAMLVMAAKIAVTPPQVIGNFFMSRMIARA